MQRPSTDLLDLTCSPADSVELRCHVTNVLPSSHRDVADPFRTEPTTQNVLQDRMRQVRQAHLGA